MGKLLGSAKRTGKGKKIVFRPRRAHSEIVSKASMGLSSVQMDNAKKLSTEYDRPTLKLALILCKRETNKELAKKHGVSIQEIVQYKSMLAYGATEAAEKYLADKSRTRKHLELTIGAAK